MIKHGEKTAAIICFKSLIETYPTDLKYYEALGFIYETQNRHLEAYQLYTLASSLKTVTPKIIDGMLDQHRKYLQTLLPKG